MQAVTRAIASAYSPAWDSFSDLAIIFARGSAICFASTSVSIHISIPGREAAIEDMETISAVI